MENRIMRTFIRLVRDNSGQFALLTAFMTPVAIILAAFAVDAGSLYVEKREAQGRVDLAAITAAANLSRASEAARLTMSDNGVTSIVTAQADAYGKPVFSSGIADDQIVAVTGNYRGAPGIAPELRFVAGAEPRNAVKVTYKTTGTRYFASSIIPTPEIIVEAIGESSSWASFSIGSRLLDLRNEGLVNQLLGGLLGSNINLSLMDYKALLGANISLLGFLDALAIETGITAGSYTQVLDAEVTMGQISRALSNSSRLPADARMAAGRLAQKTSASNAPRIRLADFLNLGDTGGQILQANVQQLGLDFNVMELVTGSALVAGKGKHVTLNLGATVPGLLATRVTLLVGEPPQYSWIAVGTPGQLVRTAQTRLTIVAEIGGPLGANIRIPLYLELAYGEAKLREVTCPDGNPDNARVVIDARPGVANLYLAEVDPSKISGFANPAPRSPANLLHVPVVVTVSAQAHAEIGNMAYTPLTFTRQDRDNKVIKKVSTTQLTGSLTQSLLSSLDPKVTALGGILQIGLPANLGSTVALLVRGATGSIDALLTDVLSLLGIAIGEVDIRVYQASCGRAVLVQ